jgi:hypothetical protein
MVDGNTWVVADMLPGTSQLIEKGSFTGVGIARKGHEYMHWLVNYSLLNYGCCRMNQHSKYSWYRS